MIGRSVNDYLIHFYNESACYAERCAVLTSVRLSVWLSVTRWRCVKMNHISVMRSSLEDSSMTMVYSWLTSPPNPFGILRWSYPWGKHNVYSVPFIREPVFQIWWRSVENWGRYRDYWLSGLRCDQSVADKTTHSPTYACTDINWFLSLSNTMYMGWTDNYIVHVLTY